MAHPIHKPSLTNGYVAGPLVDEIGPDPEERLQAAAWVFLSPERLVQTAQFCVCNSYHLCTNKPLLNVPKAPDGLTAFLKIPALTLVPVPGSFDATLLSSGPFVGAVHAVPLVEKIIEGICPHA